MIKISCIYGVLGACIIALPILSAHAKQWSLEADIDAGAEYNDNIFLTSQPHDSVTGIIITPTLEGIIREEHWEAKLDARIRSNNYSDHNLDSNDQYFDLTGRYNTERNIFSINVNYDLDSNLNVLSSDFGVTGRRVNRKNQSITPQYTRLMTERLVFMLSYTYSDVDYLEAENTGFTPYLAQTGSASLIYNLSEKDKLTISLQAVDYASKNDLLTYQLFMSRIGVDHEFSETLSLDSLLGVSRRNSTSLQTQTFDFFGNLITLTQETDFSDRGFVLDAGITQLLESGKIEGRISRDNTTNSFGGLNQVDQFKIIYGHKISELWRYTVSGRYEDVTAISSGTRSTDRDVIFFESIAFYSLSRNWDFSASYRYVQRKFKSDTSDNKAPYSNRLYVGLRYNFPSLSTF